MRPHHLALTAFGPFAGTVEVDLDALSSAGVFLLHGETGAGKTTLLDALGFALYGRVPGERGKAKRLRSDHAGDDVRTSVALEVTLAGRRLRITRSPQQDKPSSRGGSTVVQAKVQLDELVGGAWQSLSTRVGEADAEITDLMGMSAEQFFQVVLLPQGEFATFLRADAVKRGELLARLFGTDRYRAVEEWLAERRRSTAAEVSDAEQELRVLAARLAQVAGIDEPEQVSSSWAEQVVAGVGAAGLASASALAASRSELVAAQAGADAAATLAGAQARRAQALARRAQLEASAADRAQLAEELAAARRAAVVRPRLDDLTQRRAAQAQAERAAEEALTSAGQPLSALPAVLTAQRARVVRLEGLQSVAAALDEEQRLHAEALSDIAVVDAADAARADRAAALPLERAEVDAHLQRSRAALTELPALADRLQVVRRTAADLRALGAAQAQLAQAQDELTLARESAVALREKAVEVREARVDSMIAELAFHLEQGTPCPVCGGLDHPDPSLLTGARVTRDDEDQAQADYDAARAQVEQAAVLLAAAQTSVAELTERLGAQASRPVVDVEAELADLTEQVGRTQQLASDGEALARALSLLVAEQTELEVTRTRAAADRTAAQRRAAESDLRGNALARQLAEALDGASDLATALTAAQSGVALVELALARHEELVRTGTEVAAAVAAAAAAAEDAGFPTADEAEAAVRPADWLAVSEAALSDAAREEVAVATVLADPALDVPLAPAAPVERARTSLQQAQQAHDLAAAEAATAAAAVVAAGALAPRLTTDVAALEPVRVRAEQVRHLADLAAGTSTSNTLRMSLSSFVLAARLEEVALAASERLLRMSQGRFSLVHTDTGRGGGRAGLGLLARDTWTGQDRETSTLSGGETFLASLALALGLADVVAAESGGARIEALFVDEGFGTLDEETLDEVMDVLDGLREGGRVVGVVSHVAELRHRIPSQVQVRKARSGSALEVVGC